MSITIQKSTQSSSHSASIAPVSNSQSTRHLAISKINFIFRVTQPFLSEKDLLSIACLSKGHNFFYEDQPAFTLVLQDILLSRAHDLGCQGDQYLAAKTFILKLYSAVNKIPENLWLNPALASFLPTTKNEPLTTENRTINFIHSKSEKTDIDFLTDSLLFFNKDSHFQSEPFQQLIYKKHEKKLIELSANAELEWPIDYEDANIPSSSLTPALLIWAIRAGKLPIVEHLLKNLSTEEDDDGHLPINFPIASIYSKTFSSCLYHAIYAGQIGVVTYFLNKGALINDDDYGNREFAICLALKNPHQKKALELGQYLIDNGATIEELSLEYDTREGHFPSVTPLIYFIQEQNYSNALILINKFNANITTLDEKNKSPLSNLINTILFIETYRIDPNTHLPSFSEESPLELLTCLIEKGADYTTTDDEGRTFLMNLINEAPNLILLKNAPNLTAVAKILIEAGLNVNAVDDSGMTALDYLLAKLDQISQEDNPLKKEKCDVLKQIAAHMYNLNVNCETLNARGDTPLIHFIRIGSFKAVQILSRFKANFNAKNSNNYQAWLLALLALDRYTDRTEERKNIFRHIANTRLNLNDSNSFSLLHFSIQKGLPTAVEILLELKTSNRTNKESALNLALKLISNPQLSDNERNSLQKIINLIQSNLESKTEQQKNKKARTTL